ncbi:hypothetical protein PtB15_2B187 [Puccinia triticina]|nr:hypothetical protein PtB15_2B187 [Puccinia triticina]
MFGLGETCLQLVSRQLNSILSELRDSEQESSVGREKQLTRLLDFFTKPARSRPGSASSAGPSIAPHLVKRLVKLYVEHVSPDTPDYGPNELPLLFYLAICSIYSDLDTFGFTTREPHAERPPACYHQLRLDRPVELGLVQNIAKDKILGS